MPKPKINVKALETAMAGVAQLVHDVALADASANKITARMARKLRKKSKKRNKLSQSDQMLMNMVDRGNEAVLEEHALMVGKVVISFYKLAVSKSATKQKANAK